MPMIYCEMMKVGKIASLPLLLEKLFTFETFVRTDRIINESVFDFARNLFLLSLESTVNVMH